MNIKVAEDKYVDFYNEGRVLSVDDFLRQKGLDQGQFKNSDEKAQFIMEEPRSLIGSVKRARKSWPSCSC